MHATRSPGRTSAASPCATRLTSRVELPERQAHAAGQREERPVRDLGRALLEQAREVGRRSFMRAR